MRILVVASLVALAFAGCLDTGSPAAVEPESTDDVEQVEAPPVFGPHSGLPLEQTEDWEPRLDRSPDWVLGEWWDITATNGFNGATYDIRRVVAGKEGADFLVGMPELEFDDEIMVLHHPGMGLIRSDSLGYETHDFLFEPVKFPLEEGATWTSLWQANNRVVTHTVESVDDETKMAQLIMTGAQSASYTYDANLGTISRFDAPGYLSWEVVDHGFDYEGTVRVPHGHDMTIYHGRLGPVSPVQQSPGIVWANAGLGLCTPVVATVCADAALPMETFTIPAGYDRASFSVITVDLVGLQSGGPSAGYYQVTGTASDGSTFEGTQLPGGPAATINTFAVDDPAGEWSLQVVAGGPGQAFIEGVSYVTFDVMLPEGCVMLTENIHDHGGICGAHVHGIE